VTVFFILALAVSLGAARYFRAIPAANAVHAAAWVFVTAVYGAAGHVLGALGALGVAVFFTRQTSAAIRTRSTGRPTWKGSER
jgi:hypothetical protein